tara:strand:+ start:342 stop:581 length:240 start_codon:yes stop_codon:yes gene_type:complete
MKINKKLKNAEFEYDEKTKTFTIMEEDGFHGHIQLNKVYAFAFVRFVFRVAQRNWLRNKKPIDEHCENMIESENQLKMF